eukprot:2013481-Pyramimonas_sp.AAC.1
MAPSADCIQRRLVPDAHAEQCVRLVEAPAANSRTADVQPIRGSGRTSLRRRLKRSPRMEGPSTPLCGSQL